MEQINYEKLIPAQPEEDVVAFALEQGAFKRNYLIYRLDRVYEPLEDRMKDAVRVTCSACGEHFYADKIKADGCLHSYASAPFGWLNGKRPVISGNKIPCPLCGAEAETVHVSGMRLYSGELVDDGYVTILSRLPVGRPQDARKAPEEPRKPVEGRADRLTVTDWLIRRCINKEGTTRYEIWPYTAFVVEERKIVQLMGYIKNIGGAISLFGHWKQRKTFANCAGGTGMVMPWDPVLLEGTTAADCKLDLYQEAGGEQLAAYLALWRRRPAVENLLVQGCGKLVKNWIKSEVESYLYHGGIPRLAEVNWKEKRPAQMLGLNKEEFRQLRAMRWSMEDLERYKMTRDAGISVRLPEDMELLKHLPAYAYHRFLAEAPRTDFWRILRYLKKQKSDWITLCDYWRMAREDGRNLEEGLVRFPRDVKTAHQRQIDDRRAAEARKEAAKRAEQIAARAPLFQARAEALDRLSFALDGLLIRPCANEKELIAEGKLLHHCVGGYAKDHADGKTAILFIRKADKPDEPYFTLEFDEKKLVVKQNRGLRNCDRTPEVEAFEAAWLAWVKANMKKARIRVA